MQNSSLVAHGAEAALAVGLPLRERGGDEHKIERARYQVWTRDDVEYGRVANPIQELTEGLLAVTRNERPMACPDAILALGRSAGLNIDDINPFQSPRTVAMTLANTAAQLGCADRTKKLIELSSAICCAWYS